MTGREDFIDWVSLKLLGPAGGFEEVLEPADAPTSKYLTGILSPQEGTVPAMGFEELENEDSFDDDESSPSTASQTVSFAPSTLGLSFLVSEDARLRIEIFAAKYSQNEKKKWLRSPIVTPGKQSKTIHAKPHESRVEVVSGLAVRLKWRRYEGQLLVTATLVNENLRPDSGRDDSLCFFQCGMEVHVDEGTFKPYPTSKSKGLAKSLEDQVLEYRYRNAPTFAIGHGVAASWKDESKVAPTCVKTEFLPVSSVYQMSSSIPQLGVELSVKRLSELADDNGAYLELDTLASEYDKWIGAVANNPDLTQGPVRDSLVGDLEICSLRVKEGIALLRSNKAAAKAFALANAAMLLQFERSSSKYAGSFRKSDDPVHPMDFTSLDAKWRPFQIAFMLMILPSLTEENHSDREIVDLLWFPTGGGKTEAYLGILAYAMFYRRITMGPAGAGTVAITRYTLRLLTTQQFQRAATLICAAEYLRLYLRLPGHPSYNDGLLGLLGMTPFTIGLWLGGDTSPNDVDAAARIISGTNSGGASFQVEKCFWCGTQIWNDSDRDASSGITVDTQLREVKFRCLNKTCEFQNSLPVQTVDELLYKQPPTLLVGTVDKFARFVWESSPSAFLGGDGVAPPSLIIQDEFHLISGPLGTIVGAYEAAFDVLLRRRGSAPKIIASSATVRNSKEQVRGVFGRDSRVFPPPGPNHDDSFFAKVDKESSRSYVGVLPTKSTAVTGMAKLSAACMQATMELDLDSPLDDAYFTIIAYHNSLRELGKSVSLARDDIPFWMATYASDPNNIRNDTAEPEEITSNLESKEIQILFEKLSKTRDTGEALGFVASSNMFSVGVDVGRLGLMIVSGQPKSMSEYIQATSRVGRQSNRPGLIFSLFSPMRARDRSHFETFTTLHSSLYRFVESQSVTPFAEESRRRTLHALIVLLARHAAGWPKESQAKDVDFSSEAWQELRGELLNRINQADPTELEASKRQIQEIEIAIEKLKIAANGNLVYKAAGQNVVGILKAYGDARHGIETLTSMRSVDAQTGIRAWSK